MNALAPPIEGQKWLNTDFSSWDELRGRTIVLVFWALADEASLARLHQVQSLSERHEDVTAIGIHTPRILCEDNIDNLRSALAQHKLTLPVVHDPDYTAWSRYNPAGWPTTIVIGDRLNVLGAQAGVDYFETVEEAVGLSVGVAKQRRSEAAAPRDLQTSVSWPATPENELAFPTCVRSLGGNQIAVVDSGHDRILIAEWEPERSTLQVSSIIGGFNSPHAIAVGSNSSMIYVSEPSSGSVLSFHRTAGETRSLTQDLLRPVGLALDVDGSLVVADSAAEQLLRIADPNATEQIQLGTIAGTGQSGSDDGKSHSATLMQPVAMLRTEVGLLFCEAAGSSLRLLTDTGKLTTIIGQDSKWGHVDGPAHQARLQCPTDLAVLHDGSILIVDMGNNKLRRLSNRRVKTVGPQDLNRPGSACLMPSGHVLVADTGSSRILCLDQNLRRVTPLSVEGLPRRSRKAKSPSIPASDVADRPDPGTTPAAAPKTQKTPKHYGVEGEKVVIDFPAPSSGPWLVSIHGEPSSLLASPVSVRRESSSEDVVLTLGAPGAGQLIVRSELERDSTIHRTAQIHLEINAANDNATVGGT